MKSNTAFGGVLAGVGVGAALMYFLDPNRGARRRALVSDKAVSVVSRLPGAIDVTVQDLSNRAYGFWAETIRMFSSDNASDQVIEARVRSKMGRVVSHPHAVHVSSQDGNVILDGVILADEVPGLLACAEKVRGVKTVANRLREYKSPQGIPSLQGGRPRESRSEFMQENWSPAARFVAGTVGAGAVIYGLSKPDTVGLSLGVVGTLLLARSISNIETKRLLGTGGGRRAVTVEKSINVNAPPDVLFNLWANFENFPKFMTNVKEVRQTGAGNSHWVVSGPAGTTVEWDAEITRVSPNELIAWKSIEGSLVANAGYVLFEPNDDGSTEVTVRISYNPPAGAAGHAVATIFGADPKSQMDADLLRMKTLLETGQAPHDAAQAQRSRSAVYKDQRTRAAGKD